MDDTLFIQFYNEIKGSYFDLCNGFSDTYDLCKSKGDFYWTHHEVDHSKWHLEETYTGRALPVNKGTVYISAVYLNHLVQSYIWAKEYPNIRFIVGGPIAAERRIDKNGWDPVYLKIDNDNALPVNLEITGRSVEDWFEVPNFSGQWKLDVPEFVPDDSPIYFSYTLDNGCFWGKCIFCNIALHARDFFRRRKNIKFEFKDIQHDGIKIIRLNTGSITTKFIREMLPQLPCGEDMEYRMFIRSAQSENDALKDVLKNCNEEFPRLVLGFGMEFPSDRMLKHTGKGCDTHEMLAFLRLCHRHNIRINANFILGWNNLIEEDIRELEDFMECVPENSITTVQVRWLFAHPYTRIHDTYAGEQIRFGPFYEGFRAVISEKQMALNKQAGDIISQYSRIKHYKVDGMGNIRKNL